jgi:hypothetical protein
MGKGSRIKVLHSEEAIGHLRGQKEELIQQLALARTNIHNMNIVIGCLVKRFGGALTGNSNCGWRILVTDEEFEALDGVLEVHRSENMLGIVLTLREKKEEVNNGAVGEDQRELDRDPSEATVQEEVQEQDSVEGSELSVRQDQPTPPEPDVPVEA